jgi:hypothetical protein
MLYTTTPLLPKPSSPPAHLIISAATRLILAINLHTACSLYQTFQTSPHFILPRHKYLFKSRSLVQHLCLNYDSLSCYLRCWLWSVEEACQLLAFQVTQQRETSQRFHQFFSVQQSSSHDSTYAPSSTMDDETLASFPKTESTASITTMSSLDSHHDEDSISMQTYMSPQSTTMPSMDSQLNMSRQSDFQPRINKHISSNIFRHTPRDATQY